METDETNSRIDVVLERDSANDVVATVVKIYCASGSEVRRGQRLFDFETSKAVQEVYAPADGVVAHNLTIGCTVPLGQAVAQVSIRDPDASQIQFTAALQSPSLGPSVRFSQAAREAAKEYGLTSADFSSRFITRRDVLERPGAVGDGSSASRRHRDEPKGAELSEKLTPSKREEITALSRGAGASMLSFVATSLGRGSFFRDGFGFFERRIVDVVAYEASRLMPRFRKFNARFRDDTIEYHNSVNAGVAFDGGGRLVVYAISASDKLSLPDIQHQILNGFKSYVRNPLGMRNLSEATFVITDLSSTGVDFVLPLLPSGQSCIIGIARSSDQEYRLYLGFDHRITEGLEASSFLQELRSRIVSSLANCRDSPKLECSFCKIAFTAKAASSLQNTLIPLVAPNGEPTLCCHHCWCSRMAED